MYLVRLIFSFFLIIWFSDSALSQTIKPVTASDDQSNVYQAKQDMLTKIKSNIERRQNEQTEEDDENQVEGNKIIKSDSTQTTINNSSRQKLKILKRKD